jgi:alkanesulfonate monooxygenase SsuD/methylene tetrahydromethanopterin reductase-like flavin-dependent oxidoreductase (luciferase family)
MAANVDIMSGGRLVFGIGAGWEENEHRAYGIHFGTVRERMDRLDEACQIIISLWGEENANFEGMYYQLEDAPLYPKPLQQPYPEFLIGGGGIKRILRMVAKYADHWNDWGGPANFEYKNPILEKHCEAVGRDPDEITCSANMPLLISEDKKEIERLRKDFALDFGLSEDEARDFVLGGNVSEIQDTLGELLEAKVDMICIPTFYPQWSYEQLDQFIEEVAPAFR